MSAAGLTPEQHVQSVDLATLLIEAVPDGTTADVAAIAALTLVRYIAASDPSYAPRIAAVLSHIADELVSGELFLQNPH